MSETPTPTPDDDVLVASGGAVTAPVPGGYPVQVTAVDQVEYARFMPLIKWLLLIPQYIALFFVGIAALVTVFIAFFAVLFTGKFPRGMWDFLVGVHRWALRVTAYHMLITDVYPAFSLDEKPGDTVKLHAEYPEHVGNWRALVAWLLVIPYAIVASIIVWIASICSFFAFFTIIFTKKIPDGLFNVIRNGLVWQTRSGFYMYFMSTIYPPFEWEDEK